VAWVRYDDQFPINGKVTAVIADDAGALALQLLANTWSNTTKFPGYIPPHQPGMLLADKALAAQWAAVLVRHGMFHERGNECPECKEEYAGLPDDKMAGWVIHNAKDYRPPARDRTTPGTPADLSEKRREAGRKGGKTSAARRATGAKQKPANEANQATGQANAEANPSNRASKTADGPKQTPEPEAGEVSDSALGAAETTPSGTGFAGVSKASNLLEQSVSPVPVPVPGLASNEARVSPTVRREAPDDDEPPTLAGMPAKPKREPTNNDTAFGIARWWIDKRKTDGEPVVVNSRHGPMHYVQKAVVAWLSAYSEAEIKKALEVAKVGVPTQQQLERALKTVRKGDTGQDWAATNRNGGRKSIQVHDTHTKTYKGLKGRTA
jgi:hypothetical protein